MLEISKFKAKHFVEETYNKSGYGNEVKKKITNKKKWIVPQSLKPGSILIMDSLTCHKSSNKAKLPRIAINVTTFEYRLTYDGKTVVRFVGHGTNVQVRKFAVDPRVSPFLRIKKEDFKRNTGIRWCHLSKLQR